MCVYIRMKGIQGACPVLCIAELVQRLSFGLLIPFYSTGIMCYSNPSPIWGVWRWHEDDVTARDKRRERERRITGLHSVTTLHERETDYGMLQ